jgi:hypothetical protein
MLRGQLLCRDESLLHQMHGFVLATGFVMYPFRCRRSIVARSMRFPTVPLSNSRALSRASTTSSILESS